MRRRHLLTQGLVQGLVQPLVLAPLAAALLAACGDDETWPDGMAPIKWDRDTCARCGMVISDRRFAAQLRGGPLNEAIRFDDIGCATTWCAEKYKTHGWLAEPGTRFWVAAFNQAPVGESAQDSKLPGARWLDARQAHYVSGHNSPMGYNLAAHAGPQTGSIDFDTMSQKTSATWPAQCKPFSASRDAAAPSPTHPASGARAP